MAKLFKFNLYMRKSTVSLSFGVCESAKKADWVMIQNFIFDCAKSTCVKILRYRVLGIEQANLICIVNLLTKGSHN